MVVKVLGVLVVYGCGGGKCRPGRDVEESWLA